MTDPMNPTTEVERLREALVEIEHVETLEIARHLAKSALASSAPVEGGAEDDDVISAPHPTGTTSIMDPISEAEADEFRKRGIVGSFDPEDDKLADEAWAGWKAPLDPALCPISWMGGQPHWAFRAGWKLSAARSVPVETGEALEDALLSVVDAVRNYIVPDGIGEQECLSRIIGATDSPKINPIIREIEHGRS